ncbi:MAG: glycosyltransferase family 1 protein [bacterium]
MTKLLIDGWYLGTDGVGLAVYARWVTSVLLDLAPKLRCEMKIAVPAGYSTPKCASASAANTLRLRCPGTGQPLLDHALWSNRLGAYCAAQGRKCILFSPAPFWSAISAPRNVVVYHDCIYRHFPKYLGRLWLRKWLTYKSEAFLAGCTAVITDSKFSKEEIIRYSHVESSRVNVIPLWLPDEYNMESARRNAAAVRKTYGLPEHFWLYVGGYDYRKNVNVLLDAYARASAVMECPPLVLAGAIPTTTSETLCDVAGALNRLKLNNSRVLKPGFIAGKDMPGLYGAAELLIYPSLCEGFGLPPLEAMGCGCPAVVADNSSLPEVVRDSNYRFPATAAGPLVEILQRAAKTPLALNPSFTRESCRAGNAAEQYVNLLQRVIADGD